MKKIFIFVLTIIVVMTAGTTIVAAANTPVDAVTSATPVAVTAVQPTTAPAATTTSSAITTDLSTNVVIAPDSLLYPIKRMVESVQVTLTFTPEGKAELLVSFANERLAEANLMTEKNKQQLVQKVMEAYIKTINEAADRTAEAAKAQKDVKPILESIQITEQTAGNFVIKATGIVTSDISEQLKTAVAANVQKTIAAQAATEAKNQFKAANDQVKQARENLKLATEGGSDTMVKSANDELLKAQQLKDKAQELKKQAEAYKGQINRSLEQDEDIDDENDSQLDEQTNENDDEDQLDKQDNDEQDNDEQDNEDRNDNHGNKDVQEEND